MSETTPLDDHLGPAFVAHLIGGDLLGLDVRHVGLSTVQVLAELLVEIVDGGDIIRSAFFNFVEQFLHAGGVLHLHDIGEALHE